MSDLSVFRWTSSIAEDVDGFMFCVGCGRRHENVYEPGTGRFLDLRFLDEDGEDAARAAAAQRLTAQRMSEKGARALTSSRDTPSSSLVLTAEARILWELYALAKQQAEDTLLSADGLAAAQAFWSFVESFMPQVYGGNVVPPNLRRGRR